MTQSTEPSPSLNRSELVPNPWIFTSVSVDFRPLFYLFTSTTVQIPVQTALKCGTEPLQYVTLHFRDQRGAAQPRSVTEIAPKSPFFWVNRSIPSGAGTRAIRFNVNIALFLLVLPCFFCYIRTSLVPLRAWYGRRNYWNWTTAFNYYITTFSAIVHF